MSVQITEPKGPVETAGPESGSEETLGANGIKALQAERDAHQREAKRANDLAARLQAIEEKNLSDIELANKRAEDATATAATLVRDNARLNALAKYPVPADYQDLVQGTDADSFEASAKKLSELAALANGGPKRPDPIHESGSGNTTPKDKSGGSIAAGRDMFAAKSKKKEG